MDTIDKHLQFLEKTTSETCDYLYSKSLNSIQMFCLGLLERQKNGSFSLKTLFQNADDVPKHHFSIGIIIRSLLLDTLIAMNLYKLLKESEDSNKTKEETEELITEFCETILSDGLEKTFTYLKTSKDFGFINKQKLEESYNNMAIMHKPLLNPHAGDGTKPILKHTTFYSPTKLFKELAITTKFKNIASLYDTYLYFSKYDHFGILYYQVLREKHEKKMKIYLNAIEAFLAAQSLLHITLEKYSSNDKFLNNQASIADKYLLEEVVNNM